jgi:hypothetical protein
MFSMPILGYVVAFLIWWTVFGFLFTMLLWPIICKRINEDYPRINVSEDE